jgi:hypothetical protein
MAINVTVEQKEEKEISFPCIMKYVGPGSGMFIVLFTSKTAGTVLYSENCTKHVGEHCHDFSMFDEMWEPSPPITLSNA